MDYVVFHDALCKKEHIHMHAITMHIYIYVYVQKRTYTYACNNHAYIYIYVYEYVIYEKKTVCGSAMDQSMTKLKKKNNTNSAIENIIQIKADGKTRE